MKIYTEKNIEDDSVELLLNYKELSALTDALVKFENDIKQFMTKNKGKKDLGFTHLHFKECGTIGGNSKADVVFYVDLDDDV